MISRVIFIIISVLFSVYCIFVAFLTFFGKNAATYHLQKIYIVGFSAAYAILTPFGIAGIIGGLNRKKSLIRGFMIQYWFATLAFIGLSIGLLFMARKDRRDTFSKCIGELAPTDDPDVVAANKQSCVDKVFSLENIIRIAAYAQGGALVFFGILVLICGIREFKDIKMDEETSNLIEKASFNDKNEIQSDISSITSGHNLLLPPERSLNRNPSSASSAYSNSSTNSSGSGLNRYPPTGTFSPHGETLGRGGLTNASIASPPPFPPPTNYRHPNATNLSRHPTNASNYTTITTASSLSSASSNYSRYNPNVNRAHPQPVGGGGISRYPTNASNYSSISSNSNRSNRSNYSNHSNHSNHSIPRRNYNATPPPPIPNYPHNLPPPSSLSQRPLQQYSSIPDNNRFVANKTPPLINNNNNIPPLTVNDKPILEAEEYYDDYNNYN